MTSMSEHLRFNGALFMAQWRLAEANAAVARALAAQEEAEANLRALRGDG